MYGPLLFLRVRSVRRPRELPRRRFERPEPDDVRAIVEHAPALRDVLLAGGGRWAAEFVLIDDTTLCRRQQSLRQYLEITGNDGRLLVT